MWRDFDAYPMANVGQGTLVFGFPDQGPPEWRQLWRAIVRSVAVTPTQHAKDELLDNFARGSGVRTLGFVNAHALNSCVADPRFARDLLGLDQLVRDGIGVHALYRLIGSRSGLNLNGTDLLPELIARFKGRRIALFGTQLRLVNSVAAKLRTELNCEVMTADGFQADGYYLERIARERPDLVVLGMGMPKQERVAQQLKHSLHQDIAIVCGGAILDFLSGDKPRAPLWMRRAGLEWAFRLSLEPKRLFGRYVIGNPLFLLRSALLALRLRFKPTRARTLPERRTSTELFGVGGPVPTIADTVPMTVVQSAPAPTPVLAPPSTKAAISVFSANRPVVARDDLFGRQRDIDRLLAWVLDQNGNALIYGPRGYGKTSLVRVFGEIADSRHHVVLYASGSRNITFDAIMRQYLGEMPVSRTAEALPKGLLSVQQVAAHLASASDGSLVIIIDEFDRIERADTRESLIELIKDVSDLIASVRFVIVGVATDVNAILGYHPSVHRSLMCVPLSRLAPKAIEDLFVRKAAADGLGIDDDALATVVRLSAGSAYHTQLIGQKLVSETRRGGQGSVAAGDLDRVIDDILSEAAMMDDGFARLARAMRDGAMRATLVMLAQQTLSDPDDVLHLPPGSAGGAIARLCAKLSADGILYDAEPSAATGRDGDTGAYRFTNAFLPQLLLMIEHRAVAHPATD